MGTITKPRTVRARPEVEFPPHQLRWVEVWRGAPYFSTEDGNAWTPIGQNDAITWPDLAGLYRRKDITGVEAYLEALAGNGVTCLRLMLEYCQTRGRHLERSLGVFAPPMVQLWDDMFALCERYGLRILLTPFDTFWMWRRWRHHPYNQANGGPCGLPSRLLLCGDTRAAIKNRFTFAIERWAGSGALFAWDLWNEIHPGQAEERADCFSEFIADLSDHVRSCEQRLYGRSHPQTVSMFGPEIVWRPWLDLKGPIFRHTSLDFATIHVYRQDTIDNPRNTVEPAISMGEIVRDCIAEIGDGRPFLDTEHGPIETFKDFKITLPRSFDDEYFRHLQWAHFASGGAGGGMRWPNRHPHTLTPGMRRAQCSLARFLPLIDWTTFRRRNLNDEVTVSSPASWTAFACGDDRQAVVWLLRTDQTGADGRVSRSAPAAGVMLHIPGLASGSYSVTAWNTATGTVRSTARVESTTGPNTAIALGEVTADMAVAVTPLDP